RSAKEREAHGVGAPIAVEVRRFVDMQATLRARGDENLERGADVGEGVRIVDVDQRAGERLAGPKAALRHPRDRFEARSGNRARIERACERRGVEAVAAGVFERT